MANLEQKLVNYFKKEKITFDVIAKSFGISKFQLENRHLQIYKDENEKLKRNMKKNTDNSNSVIGTGASVANAAIAGNIVASSSFAQQKVEPFFRWYNNLSTDEKKNYPEAPMIFKKLQKSIEWEGGLVAIQIIFIIAMCVFSLIFGIISLLNIPFGNTDTFDLILFFINLGLHFLHIFFAVFFGIKMTKWRKNLEDANYDKVENYKRLYLHRKKKH